jgi:hypothetical protein
MRKFPTRTLQPFGAAPRIQLPTISTHPSLAQTFQTSTGSLNAESVQMHDPSAFHFTILNP